MKYETIERSGKKTGGQKIIFVCSPYRPLSENAAVAAEELKQNKERVNQACRLLTVLGCMPLAPHAYFTGFLDEEKEREKGLQFGMEWLNWADELWTFGSHISAGMSAEIARATELGIPVRAMPEPSRLIIDFVRAIQKDARKADQETKADTEVNTDAETEEENE